MEASEFVAQVEDEIVALAHRSDSSARVLLVTVIGDSIAPRDSSVWLSSLAELLSPFGVSDRLVRTSVQRLVSEGILQRTSAGRRSFYSVTDEAQSDFYTAEELIYHRKPGLWDRSLTMVVVPDEGISTEIRASFRAALCQNGFQSVRSGLLISHTQSIDQARRVAAEAGIGQRVAFVEGHLAPDDATSGPLLTSQSTSVKAASGRYTAFVDRYAPLADSAAPGSLSDAQAFGLRTLVVHDLRRAALVDPRLHEALLPCGWIGARAFSIAGELYRSVTDRADAHVEATCLGIDGTLGEPQAFTTRRFFQAS